MTIAEITRMIRNINDDLGAREKYSDTYYTDKIILAFGDLEFILGKISMRSDKFQFVPLRNSDKSIRYESDGVTPKIDPDIYYNPYQPSDYDTHIPGNAIVNKGLTKATGAEYAVLESADFIDEQGFELSERDIALIKIDVLSETDTDFSVDVSLDNRESWIVSDYDKTLDFTNNTTGYVDVSDIPSKKVALKWVVTSGTIKSTVFERYYVPESTLRHYAHAIMELAYARILDIQLKNAIENQNDPLVINGIKAQIDSIRQRHGVGKRGGNIKDTQGKAQGIVYYPKSRESDKVFGVETQSDELLTTGRVISITNTGDIRRG